MPSDIFGTNGATTTVTSGGTTAPAGGTSESWTVASSTGFPAAVTGTSQFRVGDPAQPGEIVLVTNVSGTTWTVTRGAESTTPVAHASGFTVYAVLTTGVLAGFATSGSSGMANPMTTLGDIIYENASPAAARLAGSTSATKNFLTQTGTGSVSAAPAWGTIATGDVPTLNQNTTGTAAGLSATLAIGSGGTGQVTASAALNALGGAAVAGDIGNTSASPQVTATHLASALPVNQGGTGSATRNFAGLLTPTAVKTGAYTAVAGDFVPCDTTSAGFTVTLPNAPADLSVVGIKQVTQGGTNTVTIACAGSDVFNKTGGATSGTLTLLAQGMLLQYKSAGGIWYVVSDDLPLTQLDSRYVAQSSLPLAIASGGTGQASKSAAFNALSPNAALGDITYGSGTNTSTNLSGNTSATKNFLSQTGTGSVSAAPAWGTITSGDLPAGTTSAQGALQLDGTAGDLHSDGTAAAGSTGKAADAGHVHPGNPPDVQFFTSTGTWTKPSGAQTVLVTILSGGGGGGSGRRGAAGTVRCGGGGGGGAALHFRQFIAADLTSTVTVTIGTGGAGGAAVTADSTNGNNGVAGVLTTFGSYFTTSVGAPGGGGTASAGTAGAGGSNGSSPGGAGAAASTTGGAGAGVNTAAGPAGGPSGGGITSGDVAGAGAAGNYSHSGGTASSTFGTAGAVDSTAPTSGTSPAAKGTPAGSPGSGAASITTAAQAGANANYGAGGAGGGASLNGNNSGAGGNGGPGFALVVTLFQ